MVIMPMIHQILRLPADGLLLLLLRRRQVEIKVSFGMPHAWEQLYRHR